MNHTEHLKSGFLDGSKSTLYMKFQKEMPSAQGMSIWNNRAFILYDTGGCGVYDLTSRNPQALRMVSITDVPLKILLVMYCRMEKKCIIPKSFRLLLISRTE